MVRSYMTPILIISQFVAFLSFKLTLNNKRLKPFTIKGFVQIIGIVLNLCLIQHIHLAVNLQKTGNKDKCLSATQVAQGLKFDRCSTS